MGEMRADLPVESKGPPATTSKRETYKEKFEEALCVVNPFLPRRFPMDEQNRLALDGVKSTKVLVGQERVNTACKQGEINQILFVQTCKFGTVLV